MILRLMGHPTGGGALGKVSDRSIGGLGYRRENSTIKHIRRFKAAAAWLLYLVTYYMHLGLKYQKYNKVLATSRYV